MSACDISKTSEVKHFSITLFENREVKLYNKPSTLIFTTLVSGDKWQWENS